MLKILLVEDSGHDAKLVLRELERAGLSCTSQRVQAEPELRQALHAFRPDIVLADFEIPGFGGMAALQVTRELLPDVPFILVSGAIGDLRAVEAMKAGANDYVMKGSLARLAPAILRELRDAETRQQRRFAEAGLRRAQTMAGLAYVVTGADGAFERWSENLPALLGSAAGALPASAREWLDRLHPDDALRLREQSIAAARSGQRREISYRLRRGDGAWVHLRATMEPLEAHAGGRRWFTTLQDVTEQKRVEEALAAMARRLVTLQEKERRDIARELHDRVGQNLTALGINLAQLRFTAAATALQREARVAECQALVEATGRVIQDVLTELKPPMLAGYGLLDAVRWHAGEFSRRTGIAVEVCGEELSPRLHPEVEMALFRIAQAALANIAQHARAGEVRVALERSGKRLRFEIRDDGVGFEPDRALASGRWGLSAMRERAEAIDADFSLDSRPGAGTRVSVELDVPA